MVTDTNGPKLRIKKNKQRRLHFYNEKKLESPGQEQLVVKNDLLFDYLSLLCLIFHQTKAHAREKIERCFMTTVLCSK